MPARAYIGTSGWNYKHWRNLIYPERMAQRYWLDYVTQHFDSVEVNTSFYRIPKEETIAAWQANTPEHFTFALKMWRGVSHYKKLKNASEFTHNFLKVAQVLEPHRRAPLLIQLPPNQGKDLEKLDFYLHELRSLSDGSWMVAVEFRNSSWLAEDTYQLLDRGNVALCIHDMIGKGDTNRENSATFVYVRRHGSAGGRYSGSYSPQQIAADGERIAAWVSEGRNVYVYYNNDIGGHAFWNARDLRATLGTGLII